MSTPTLLVRAADKSEESPFRNDPELVWGLSSNVGVVDVPGGHFTMMEEHADTTAQAVSDWLDSTF
jgi:hypothetical protein